jgi:hypothetical protein
MSERVAYTTPGPAFLRDEDGTVLFRFVNDARNVIGPRPATTRDQENHPGAWSEFQAAEGLVALDRDGKDGPGGSLSHTVEAAEAKVEPTKAQIVAELRKLDAKFNVRDDKAVLAELLAGLKA